MVVFTQNQADMSPLSLSSFYGNFNQVHLHPVTAERLINGDFQGVLAFHHNHDKLVHFAPV